MFGGPPEQVSDSELREAEKKSLNEVQMFGIACVILWYSPHVVDWARKLF